MAKEEKKKTKRPTALKRDIQNDKKRMVNKTFKTKIRTTIRSFETALAASDKENLKNKLNDLYSIMDKGVKRGIYKQNKADRQKARAMQKVAALAS